MRKKIVLLSSLLAASSMAFAQQNQQMKPEETEIWEPVPKVVTPGKNCGEAPSDAIVLFDGTSLDKWEGEKGGPAKWEVKDGALTVVKGTGTIKTKQAFEDFQLHIEWRTPAKVLGSGQGRGNSGIFLQEYYELQVLDNYENRTYSNGQAGSFYKQTIPLVNVCRKPGEWQSYDVIWTAPRFNDDGSLKSPARATVLQNGVLVENNVELKGKTLYIGKPYYEKHGAKPIVLQDHGNPVSYRNIWVRPL